MNKRIKTLKSVAITMNFMSILLITLPVLFDSNETIAGKISITIAVTISACLIFFATYFILKKAIVGRGNGSK